MQFKHNENEFNDVTSSLFVCMNSTESPAKHIFEILSIGLLGSKRELSMWANSGDKVVLYSRVILVAVFLV